MLNTKPMRNDIEHGAYHPLQIVMVCPVPVPSGVGVVEYFRPAVSCEYDCTIEKNCYYIKCGIFEVAFSDANHYIGEISGLERMRKLALSNSI